MLLRTGFRPLMVCSSLVLFSQMAPAQIKVAVVSLQAAVYGAAEIKKADVDMQARFKPRQERLQQLQQEIAGLAQQLQTNAGKLTAQAEADLQADGQKKQREAQRLQDDLNAEVEQYRSDVLSKSTQKMSEVVKKMAEEKGYDLVVDASVAVYFKTAMDITSEAIAAYDKTYPVAAPAPAPAPKK